MKEIIISNTNKQGHFPKANEEITAKEVRVIDSNGKMLGVFSLSKALEMASAEGLDLVEISGNTSPSVCKITDYGKYKYEVQKKAHTAKKKQKTIELKELKIRPNIGQGDYEVKVKHAQKFLSDGDKVKFSLRFKGREITHKEIGIKLFERIIEDIGEGGKLDSSPRMEGQQLVMIFSPQK